MREATKKATESITIQAINDLIDVANLIARESVEEYTLLVNNLLNADFRRDTYNKLVEYERLCFNSSENLSWQNQLFMLFCYRGLTGFVLDVGCGISNSVVWQTSFLFMTRTADIRPSRWCHDAILNHHRCPTTTKIFLLKNFIFYDIIISFSTSPFGAGESTYVGILCWELFLFAYHYHKSQT